MFQIHNDENSMVQGRGLNAKQQPQEGAQQKRTVLGTISNTTRTRVQPFRNAKHASNTDQENVQCRGKDNSQKILIDAKNTNTFSIFVDESDVKTEVGVKQEVSESTESLSHVLSSVLPTRVKHEATDISCTESPMVLDTSDDEKVAEKSREATGDVIVDVPEYAEEIYAYLREAEMRNRPKVGYMRKQPDITPSMRSILIDWLVEVSEEYKLHRETLFLSVNYVDRFLSQMSVLRGKLQLVGAAAMFLAAKYEEIYPPDVGEFVYITDNTYTQKQVLRMEHLILKVLAFDVAVPTTNWFCKKFLKQCTSGDIAESLAMYLCELTLVDTDTFVKYIPSTIAASAVCLAHHCLNKPLWPAHMERETGYSLSDLSECIHDLSSAMRAAPSHPQQAVQEKYTTTAYHEVANMEAPSSLPL